MENIQLSDNAIEWIEVIRHDPLEWTEGVLESLLDQDGVSKSEQEIILRRYKSFLN